MSSKDAKRTIRLACVALLIVGGSLAAAAYDDEVQPAAGGCSTAAGTKDQLVSLSKMLDPSGRLAKMIGEFKIDAPAAAATSAVAPDQIKRSPSESEEMQAAASTSNATVVAAPPSPSTPAADASSTTTQAPTSTTSSTTAAPPAAASSSTTAAPVAPMVPKATEASNVTVNVFLQLAPDPKSDELINNPDNVNSSTTANAQPEQQAASSTPAPAAPSTSTQVPVSSTEAQASSSTTPAPPASSTTAAPSSSSTAASLSSRRRRRRRDVAMSAPTSTASPAAPSSTAAVAAPSSTTTQAALPAMPSSTTTSTSTTTTTTTTTTTEAPAPSTLASTTTTTTTTTTTPAPASSTAAATPVPTKAASTSAAPATVEISAKDLPTERAMRAEAPATIEIVVSSVPTVMANSAAESAPAATIASPSPSTSTSTTTTTTTTTTEAPSSSTTTSTVAPAPSSTQAATSPTTESTTAKTTMTSSTTSTSAPSTSQATSAAAAAAAPGDLTAAGMLTEDMKEIARVAKLPDLREESKVYPDYTDATPLIIKTHLQDNQSEMQLAKVALETTTATPAASNHLDGINSDNLNVIYDNDTTIVELPVSVAKQQQPAAPATVLIVDTQQAKSSNKNMGDFVNSDRTEESERENYATCKLESNTNTTNIMGLIGRLNFWQPIQARGALHLLARFRYQEKKSSQPRSNQSERRRRRRRESFRAPVERAPENGMSIVGLGVQAPKHKVWLQEGCFSVSDRLLLAEISQSADATTPDASSPSSSQVIDVDAELVLGRYNLAGHSSVIVDKYLALETPSGVPLGCCRVSLTERMISSELDSLPSISVVQPTRDRVE